MSTCGPETPSQLGGPIVEKILSCYDSPGTMHNKVMSVLRNMMTNRPAAAERYVFSSAESHLNTDEVA